MRACGQTAKTGTMNEAGAPNITGRIQSSTLFGWWGGNTSGAFSVAGQNQNYTDGSNWQHIINYMSFDASNVNNIYGKSSTIIPESVNLSCIIYLGK